MSREHRLHTILSDAVKPLHLEVVDESHMHSVPPGSESHFKVLVVSEAFAAQAPLARHRLINRVLADEFAQGLHALSLHAWTPDEWFARGGRAPDSPPCQGGSKASGEKDQAAAI